MLLQALGLDGEDMHFELVSRIFRDLVHVLRVAAFINSNITHPMCLSGCPNLQQSVSGAVGRHGVWEGTTNACDCVKTLLFEL